jgi:hypothetical protein
MTDAAGSANAFFTELVDAVRFAQSLSEYIEKQAETKRSLERQLDALEEIQSRIAALFDAKKLDPEFSGPLAKAVNQFVSAATEQSRAKINEKLKRTVDEFSSEANSLKLKAVKSLESFLAVTPLPVLDEEVGLDLSEGSYAAYADYKCSGEIEYEFLLNTANSTLFKSALSISALWKGTRIPVRLSRVWLKKEPVPDYEKLDNYVLSAARASRNHLSATFTNLETTATSTMVFSRSNNDSFITVEYKDKAGKADVTGEPSLNRHLDLGSLKRTMGRLLDEITELDADKLRLVKLESAGEDILESLACFDFMKQVVGAFVQSGELIKAVRSLDPRMTRDRLSLLGENGQQVASALGLQNPKLPG